MENWVNSFSANAKHIGKDALSAAQEMGPVSAKSVRLEKNAPILVASIKVKEEYGNQVHDGILMLIIANNYFKLNISRQYKFYGYSSSHSLLGCSCAKG